MKFIIISAINFNGIIGINNTIPWYIPEDFKHYKDTTMGHTVIVGYNTYKSLPTKALDGRKYLVLCNKPANEEKDNVHFFENLTLLIDYIKLYYLHLDDTIYIAGGELIYKTFIDDCDECIITLVDRKYDLDNAKLFPIEILQEFTEIKSTEWITSVKDINYKIIRYKRIKL